MSGLVLATPTGSHAVARSEKTGAPWRPTTRQAIGGGQGLIELLTRSQRAATFEGMYRRQPWVHAVVNKLTKSIARLPLKTYELAADETSRTRTRAHPVARLLASPHPRATPWSLKAAVAWNLCVHANAALLKVRPGPGAPPTELWSLPWRRVEVIHDGRLAPIAYIWHGTSGEMLIIDPDDIIHFQWMAIDGLIGVSPMEALASTLALEDAAVEYIKNHFQNQARPSGAFTTKAKLDEKTFPRLRSELERLYGGIDNAGRFGIFDQDLTFESIESTASDNGLVELRKLNREEVCGAFDVPPPMVGQLERSTFNNITELHRALYQDSVGPKLTVIEETLVAQLIVPDFAGNAFVEFDPGEFVRTDVFGRADTQAKLLAAGWTLNEIRALDNLPRIDSPDADLPFVPLNLSPIGTDTASTIKIRVDAAGALVRSGFEPSDALEAVGLDPVRHLGLLPVTVQPPVDPPEGQPGDTDPTIDNQ